MPTFRPTPDLNMHYEVDDFTDPWHRPDTVLMLHGNAESGLAWHPICAALGNRRRCRAITRGPWIAWPRISVS